LIYKKLSFTFSANLIDKKIGNQSIKNLVWNVGYVYKIYKMDTDFIYFLGLVSSLKALIKRIVLMIGFSAPSRTSSLDL